MTESTVSGSDIPTLPLDNTFNCPRCSAEITRELYGPCEPCCLELRATLGGEATEIVAAEYEPKMNVTPNAVALKDD